MKKAYVCLLLLAGFIAGVVSACLYFQRAAGFVG